MNNFFSKPQCDSRKGFSLQYCLLTMWGNCKQEFGALLADLSKALPSLLHVLLIARLNSVGLSLKAFKSLKELNNKNQ